MLVWLVLLSAAAYAASQSSESRIVNTNQGPIRGYKDPNGSMYYFHDVPYATVPPGRDKFKAPLPPPVWTQPFDAVFRGIACPQVPDINEIHRVMQEDCLVAHLFVPDTNITNLPVVVHIHGGGFIGGYGITGNFDNFILHNNVIFVTFNYRVGVYGFLCLGTETVPGNAGLKDQVALLRWVKQNIASFGGNPNDVTIMGCSGGGMSVDLLTMSNMTRNLFHKAIADSGCGYGGLGMQYDPLENAKMYARRLNFLNVDDISALENFYITAFPSRLSSELMSSLERIDSGLTFAACVERDVGVEIFLKEDPAEILKDGDFLPIPLLYGLAKTEGAVRVPFFARWMGMMNDKFSDFLPVELEFESDEQRESVARTVRTFYFGNRPVSPQTILEYIDYHNDVQFGIRLMMGHTLRLRAKQQPVYLYEYTFVHENTPMIPFTNRSEAGHCEQQLIMIDEDKTGKSAEYLNMKNMMRSLWGNFIHTGQPVPSGSPLPRWPTADVNRSPYMDLGNVVQLKNNMFGARFDLWHGIYERHYRIAKRPDPHPAVPDSSSSVVSNIFVISFLVACSMFFRLAILGQW